MKSTPSRFKSAPASFAFWELVNAPPIRELGGASSSIGPDAMICGPSTDEIGITTHIASPHHTLGNEQIQAIGTASLMVSVHVPKAGDQEFPPSVYSRRIAWDGRCRTNRSDPVATRDYHDALLTLARCNINQRDPYNGDGLAWSIVVLATHKSRGADRGSSTRSEAIMIVWSSGKIRWHYERRAESVHASARRPTKRELTPARLTALERAVIPHDRQLAFPITKFRWIGATGKCEITFIN